MKLGDYDILTFLPELAIKDFSIISDIKQNNPRGGILIRIVSLFLNGFNYVKLISFSRKDPIPEESILLFGQNSNEKAPFDRLFNNLTKEEAELLFHYGSNSYKNDFPYLQIYLLSVLLIPYVLYHYTFEKDNFRLQGYKFGFDQLCLITSALIILPKHLSKLNPLKIVISNHNSPFHLLLVALSNKKNIRTTYIQHGLFHTRKFNFPIGLNEIFLDGFDSLYKLRRLYNINSQIYILGSLFQSSQEKKILDIKPENILGICINQVDSVYTVSQLIIQFKYHFPEFSIKLRPHPSDTRYKFWNNFSKNHKVIISDTNSSIYDYLSQITFLISGESNVHLMALNSGVPSMYFNFTPGLFDDWYGFVKNQLLVDCTNFHNLIKFINNKPDNFNDKLKFYNHSIQSKYKNDVPSIIANILRNDNIKTYNFITHNSEFNIVTLKN